MKHPFGTVTEFDSTMVVLDQRRAGTRELKYTVDQFGIETLLYPDSAAPAVLRHDRWARTIRRALTQLPPPVAAELIGRTEAIADGADRMHHRVVRWRARHLERTGKPQVPVGAWRGQLAHVVTEFNAADEQAHQRQTVLGLLHDAELAAITMPSYVGRAGSIAVRYEDLDQIIDALAHGLDHSWRIAMLDAPTARSWPLRRRRLRRLCERDGGVRIFRFVAAGPSEVLGGCGPWCRSRRVASSLGHRVPAAVSPQQHGPHG